MGMSSTVSVMADPPVEGHELVTICHKFGTPAEQTMEVDEEAVPGHLGHGDYEGECVDDPTQCPCFGCCDGTPIEGIDSVRPVPCK